MKGSRLGRGFDALLRRSQDDAPQEQKILELPVADIHPNPSQPRQVFDPDSLAELVGSITRNGVLQPILVRRDGDAYELIAGERRWRAAQQAGFTTIPAIVRAATDNESLELALIENIQRRDLNPIEQAYAYKDLIERFGLTQEEAAERLGKKRSSIANILRLLDLPQDIQETVSRGTLSMGHARALLSLPDRAEQRRVAARVARDELSVRQTERLVSQQLRSTTKTQTQDTTKPPHVLDLEAKLRHALGTRVSIFHAKTDRGKIQIDFFSDDDFQRILGVLLQGVSPDEAPSSPE
ncbi:ParB/RepB/Spo0J family partition protein [bacterium]|nr:ParB/RepB/Spo0J family partition protein [bacterium]